MVWVLVPVYYEMPLEGDLVHHVPRYDEEEVMDSELKQYLEAMEERLNTRITAAVTASEERLIERMRDTETTLLTEFHKWASPVDMPVRGLPPCSAP